MFVDDQSMLHRLRLQHSSPVLDSWHNAQGLPFDVKCTDTRLDTHFLQEVKLSCRDACSRQSAGLAYRGDLTEKVASKPFFRAAGPDSIGLEDTV